MGLSDHNGWAILVSVAKSKGVPVLLDRRLVELIDPGLPKQPYHHETLSLSESVRERDDGRIRLSSVTAAQT